MIKLCLSFLLLLLLCSCTFKKNTGDNALSIEAYDITIDRATTDKDGIQQVIEDKLSNRDYLNDTLVAQQLGNLGSIKINNRYRFITSQNNTSIRNFSDGSSSILYNFSTDSTRPILIDNVKVYQTSEDNQKFDDKEKNTTSHMWSSLNLDQYTLNDKTTYKLNTLTGLSYRTDPFDKKIDIETNRAYILANYYLDKNTYRLFFIVMRKE